MSSQPYVHGVNFSFYLHILCGIFLRLCGIKTLLDFSNLLIQFVQINICKNRGKYAALCRVNYYAELIQIFLINEKLLKNCLGITQSGISVFAIL